MAHYNHLLLHQNGSNSYSKSQNDLKHKCCGFSTSFIAFTLNVFNFVLLFSGLIILTIVILNESSFLDEEENLQLPVIRSLLPKSHPLNLIYFQLLICGGLICFISLLNIFNNCYYSSKNNSERKKKQGSSSENIPSELHELRLASTTYVTRFDISLFYFYLLRFCLH